MVLIAIDWIAFEALNVKNPVLDVIPIAPRIVDGLFQAIANRSAGFDVIAISQLAVGFQVMCVVMM